jgi:tetratricopeptide (TPR) repeat protein
VSRRDLPGGYEAEERPTSTSIRLKPLDPGAAAQLVAVETEGAPFPPHQISALAERSGGNPLFLKELIVAARDAGLETLPDSVEALIMARIDSLAPAERNLLRRASVVGRAFPREYLFSVLDAVPPPDDPVWHRLSGFLVEDGGSLRFAHALIRDGAYEGLPFKLRRKLHAQVGDSIERASGDTADDQAELLSLHFFHAQRFMEAWRYSLVAAERAKTIYANAEAVEFYERALEAARRIDDIAPLEAARIRESMGDVKTRIGLYSEAQTAFRAVRRIVREEPVAEARLMLKIAQTQAYLGLVSQGLRGISRGLAQIADVPGPEAGKQRAQLMVYYARFCNERGRYRDAIRWCLRAIAEAQASDEKAAMAHAYRLLDWAYVDLGELQQAGYSRQSLAISEELEDLTAQSASLNELGALAYRLGDWDEALQLYRRGAEIDARTGDTVGAAEASNNIAEILLDQGHLEEAERLFTESLRVLQAAGYRGRIAASISNLGLLASRAGDHEKALGLLAEARTLFEEVRAQGELVETDARIAEARALMGDAAAALTLADEALERARSFGGVGAATGVLQRARGMALMQAGDLENADAAFQESLRVARARDSNYEIGITLCWQAELARRNGGADPSARAEEGRRLLRALGVVRIPGLAFAEA